MTHQKANSIGFLANVIIKALEGKEDKETQRKLDNILYALQNRQN